MNAEQHAAQKALVIASLRGDTRPKGKGHDCRQDRYGRIK